MITVQRMKIESHVGVWLVKRRRDTIDKGDGKEMID